MSDLKEMSRTEVEEMLIERVQFELDLDAFDKKYAGLFCGISADKGLHVFRAVNLKTMAAILGKEIIIKPYEQKDIEESQLPYKGKIFFEYECCGIIWEVFALYADESEVVG